MTSPQGLMVRDGATRVLTMRVRPPAPALRSSTAQARLCTPYDASRDVASWHFSDMSAPLRDVCYHGINGPGSDEH